MKKLSIPWIIALFALLHAVTTLLCLSLGTDDSIILTLLTMTLTVILCVRKNLGMEFIAISVILVNIVGYFLGMGFAAILDTFVGPTPLTHGISTFLTTLMLGWGVVWFASFVNSGDKAGSTGISESQLKWLIIAVTVVLLVRIVIGGMARGGLFSDGSILDEAADFTSHFAVLLILLCASIIFIQFQKKLARKTSEALTVCTVFAFLLVVSAISALAVCLDFPYSKQISLTGSEYLETFIVAFVFEAAIYSVSYIIDYAVASRRNAEMEKAKADVARLQYLNLKQQVNPHFLFNSLNVLDALIADGQSEKAREFVAKLSGVYRYMLKVEKEPLVGLSEELEYAQMYADLLLVRFPEGLSIEKNIAPEALSRSVVTASVQMLVENAVKHNAVSSNNPLIISIFADDAAVRVSNNMSPRADSVSGANLGLKYLRQSYLDHGKDILVEKTPERYSVTLPLL